MNISFIEKSDISVRIELKIDRADYQPEVDKNLRLLRKNANLPGFRKGFAPASLIQKKYGEGVKIEAVQELVSKNLYDFMVKEQLRNLGQAIPAKDTPEVDILKGDDFTFVFDMALRPTITDLIGKEASFEYLKAQASDEDVDAALEEMLQRSGSNVDADTVGEEDFIRGTVAELDGNLPKEGGILLEEKAIMLPRYIKDADEKAKFIGAARNSVVIFNPYKAYEGNAAEIASFLSIDKEQVPSLEGKEFSFEINKINHFQKAELSQEFYDQQFGEGVVTTEAEARTKIKEALEARTEPDSNMKLLSDVKAYIKEHKAPHIQIDEETFKRWWKSSDSIKEMSDEEADKIFAEQLDLLKLDLYINALAEKYGITITEDEVKGFAMQLASMQFASYGMSYGSIPESLLSKYAENMLKDENMKDRIYDSMKEQKVAAALRPDVTLTEHYVSLSEFAKLINETPETAQAESDAE